ncbi:helix-turn-helix domain-containing protein [Flavobacterium sp. SM2513]|uniref:helix-turn-helix domain-containing protein n=1 Tax=Flavobacterium sp. SM2513 TaxID=3424766 RepID=UPI003D7FDE76
MKDDELKLLYIHIGSIVKLHREKLGKSQLHFGLEVGRSANQIGRIERAEGNTTVDTLFRIAQYINIDIKEFFNLKKDA